ncbi:hypothetical protein [Chryseobacterium sp.]|uniref:hypothetical protein n=1 Tax=Chryseobacterium sp. TaxID=1871047 RepID=UPI0011C87F6B|nr:hypothetical protein [Chryseobacterium sp.]TXF79234.1 hypothetical protein FUA25_02230 [Chryseobacterium sp.]
MKTKPTVKAYLLLLLIFSFAVLIVKIIPFFFNNPYYDDKLFPKFFVPTCTIFSFVYLIFGELRTKNIIVEIEINQINVKRYFGLKNEIYKFSEIQGWKYSDLSSKGGSYEYVYLYNYNGKKIIKISEFYHKNYWAIKELIEANFKDLGYEKFSYIDEFKEAFT